MPDAQHPVSAAASAALRVLPPQARFSLRARPAAAAACRSLRGLAPPLEACRAATAAAWAALWLGPDEWLLLAPAEDATALADAVAAALGAMPHALVEVSHAYLALELTGQGAAALNAGCPLDLDIGAFPVGMCTRTVFAGAQIILWRTEAARFRLDCARSYMDYVRALLEQAMRDSAAIATAGG